MRFGTVILPPQADTKYPRIQNKQIIQPSFSECELAHTQLTARIDRRVRACVPACVHVYDIIGVFLFWECSLSLCTDAGDVTELYTTAS